VSTIVAAVEPVIAITSLYFVTNSGASIRSIALLTSMFALSLCLLTNAKCDEIFGGSAAYATYAAVPAVFVSGNLAAPVGMSSRFGSAA
jgi:hypothetical protein